MKRLRLVSRSLVPQERDADSPDRRRLGVAVSGLAFDGVLAEAGAFGQGFHAPEPGWRWTDGVGWVSVPCGTRLMSLQLVSIETYQARLVPAPAGDSCVAIEPFAIAGCPLPRGAWNPIWIRKLSSGCPIGGAMARDRLAGLGKTCGGISLHAGESRGVGASGLIFGGEPL
ncbi:MAG TPA: hypothetical protein VGH36_00555 [Acetobacteraceae bacterium]